MLELLGILSGLAVGLFSSLWAAAAVVLSFCADVLVWVHVDHPRLEGLLVGVALAWVMLRRDKHPLLRVLSSPLKLIVDILDLAWDQFVEVVTDLIGTVKGWITGSAGWVWKKIKSVYDWKMGILRSLKSKLTRDKK